LKKASSSKGAAWSPAPATPDFRIGVGAVARFGAVAFAGAGVAAGLEAAGFAAGCAGAGFGNAGLDGAGPAAGFDAGGAGTGIAAAIGFEAVDLAAACFGAAAAAAGGLVSSTSFSELLESPVRYFA
jgi:hypothetical protein